MMRDHMTKAYSHLGPKAIAALDLPDDERIRYNWTDKWIGYSIAREIIDHMEFLLTYPKSNRMPCLLIVGDSNNGKSSIIKRFISLHPTSDNPDGRTIIAPVVFIDAPNVPDEGRLYNNILDAIFAPYKTTDHPDKKRRIILNAFNTIGVKMLIIDDFSNLLAGSMLKQRQVLNAIRGLTNDLKIPVIATGVDTSLVVIQTDPQIRSRFKHKELKRWTADEEFARLLASFEKQFALKKPSKLKSFNTTKRVLALGGNTMGDLAYILKKAAEIAIKSKVERITPQILDSLSNTKTET